MLIQALCMNKIFCKNCDSEIKKNKRNCFNCGCTKRNYVMKCETGHFNYFVGALRWKHKNPHFGLITKGVNRPFKKSGDPKLTEGVNEIYWVDKLKKMWHQIVRDLKNGEIIHEEHKSLDNKNKK